MERWKGRVALVTGASAGIGAAICKKLVASGMVVIGAARGFERIQELSKELQDQPGKLVAVKCDLSKDEDIANLFKFIRENHHGVDVCINLAGMSRNKNLLEGSPDEWREMMNINVVALCHCTREAIKSMRERDVDDGHVIHINSICGHNVINYPNAHFYMATKHAVTALSEGLRQELQAMKSNIRVSSISPGPVQTEFVERMTQSKSEDLYSKIPSLSASDVAEFVCHALSAPPRVQIDEIIIQPVGGQPETKEK